MIGVVYCLENVTNGKIYVGATTQPLKIRIGNHKYSNTLIGKAIREYGLENFKVSVLAECETLEELNEREKYWIAAKNCIYPNGYNFTSGGGNFIHSKRSEPLPEIEFLYSFASITLKIINGKWRLNILLKLFERPWRFNELKKSLAEINHKVLIENLRQMEADGIILRKDFGGFPRHVEYSLSELGNSMRPIIESLHEFGVYYKEIKSARENL